ncbi:MAG: tyrosine-type recombinase/integrase [Anaerolineae bacterium]
MLLSEAMEKYNLARQTEVENSTLTVYAYTLNKLLAYLGDMEIGEITIDDLRRWRAKLVNTPGRHQPPLEEGQEPRKLSVYTLHRDIRQTRTFFKWCVAEGILKNNPAARLALPKLPRGEPPKAISDEDLERMIAAAGVAITERPEISDGRTRQQRQGMKPYPYERDYAIVRFIAESGCRVGGLVRLRWTDLDLGAKEGTVQEKGKVSRMVPYGQKTVAALEAWRKVQPGYTRYVEFVFTSERGALSTNGLYRILQRLAVRAGVGGRHNPHSFRHALARRLLKNRADIGTVSELLGHRDIDTTHKFYARWSKPELTERHRRFGGTLD